MHLTEHPSEVVANHASLVRCLFRSFSKANDYESATTDEEEMVQDYDVRGSVHSDDDVDDTDFLAGLLDSAIDETELGLENPEGE